MKRRSLEIAGAVYVAFALLTAHSALAPTQAALALGPNQGHVVSSVEVPVVDSQRLYKSDTSAEDPKPRTDKSCYTVTIWSAGWCRKCPAYKARVKPALLKLGYTVVVKDWDKDAKERPQLRAVPAIVVHYKGEMIYLKVAATVAEVDKFVEEHMPPEPEQDEDPGDLY